MARGFDWARAKPRKPTLSILDEDAPPPPRRRFVRRRSPRFAKEGMRAIAAEAVLEFKAKKAEAKGQADDGAEDVPW